MRMINLVIGDRRVRIERHDLKAVLAHAAGQPIAVEFDDEAAKRHAFEGDPFRRHG